MLLIVEVGEVMPFWGNFFMIILCVSCNHRLNVPEVMAGRQFNCPKCKATQTAPLASAQASESEYQIPTYAEPPPPIQRSKPTQNLKTCPNCGESVLVTASKCKHCKEWIGEEDEGSDDQDYSRPSAGNSRRYVEPHRGGTILTLGILSLIICAPLGVFAWSMGGSDLSKMRMDRMDRSGEGSTRAGYVCGIIGSIFFFGGCAISIGFWLLVVIAGANSR